MLVQQNASLRRFNSFGFDSYADELLCVSNSDHLAQAFECKTNITILGEGTNVVLPDRVRGRVIRFLPRSITTCEIGSGEWMVEAESGVNWHELVRYTLGKGINGLENLALIPGSVGAAPIQNIGAYGAELSECLECVEVFDVEQHKVVQLNCEQCEFGYRTSVFKSEFKSRYLVLKVKLRLGKQKLLTHYPDVEKALSNKSKESVTATQLAEEVIRIRRIKLPDPRVVGNVGSFFENPLLKKRELDQLRSIVDIDAFPVEDGYKVPAARLIDQAGWKGKTLGAAQVWPKQPLVIVNLGGSSSREVLALAQQISQDIEDQFGVTLKIEPTVVESET